MLNNIDGVTDHKRFIESKLETEVFEKDSIQKKMHWRTSNLNALLEEVQSATNASESWAVQVFYFDDSNYNTICTKIDWFHDHLDLLTPAYQQLIQGINKDTLDRNVLHFLPIDANVILLDS